MAKRGPNPETALTLSIRGVLRLMRVEHFKHWGGPFSEKGVSDLVCTLHGGQSFYCEVKVPGNELTDEQAAFLTRFKRAGAWVMKATSPREVIQFLADKGYEPAKRLQAQLKPGDEAPSPDQATASEAPPSAASDGELALDNPDEEERPA